jgi:hypothetical protein
MKLQSWTTKEFELKTKKHAQNLLHIREYRETSPRLSRMVFDEQIQHEEIESIVTIQMIELVTQLADQSTNYRNLMMNIEVVINNHIDGLFQKGLELKIAAAKVYCLNKLKKELEIFENPDKKPWDKK